MSSKEILRSFDNGAFMIFKEEDLFALKTMHSIKLYIFILTSTLHFVNTVSAIAGNQCFKIIVFLSYLLQMLASDKNAFSE